MPRRPRTAAGRPRRLARPPTGPAAAAATPTEAQPRDRCRGPAAGACRRAGWCRCWCCSDDSGLAEIELGGADGASCSAAAAAAADCDAAAVAAADDGDDDAVNEVRAAVATDWG